MDDLEKLPEYTQFYDAIERLKRTQGTSSYWMARDIQEALAYSTWERFRDVLVRARMACESAGVDAEGQFHPTVKMVEIGSGAQREREDWFLSRYACYLLAMSGDPAKKEVAYAKTYFAIQTRRREVEDQATVDEKRLRLRNRVRDGNRALNAAAKAAGVQKYAVFHDAGYKGLYGMGQSLIKARKRIPPKEPLLDCIGRTELAANEFRITQTEGKLLRERVNSEELAFLTHEQVGKEVRATIQKLGGTMPEDLPAEQPIKKLVAAKRRALRAARSKPH